MLRRLLEAGLCSLWISNTSAGDSFRNAAIGKLLLLESLVSLLELLVQNRLVSDVPYRAARVRCIP